jgi:hypothetical protein
MKCKHEEAEKARLEQIKEEAAEKAHMEQSREVADQKVDGLLADGLEAQSKKKGKTHEKRLKTLLDNIFFTLPEEGGGVGEAVLAAVLDEAAQSNDASNSSESVELVENQVALLVFWKGTKGIDPPSPDAKNVRKSRLNPMKGPKYCYDYDYNYFEGKTAAGVLFNYQLNPAWCKCVFERVFMQLCRRKPDCWFHVPIDNAHIDEEPTV